jgi:hypothetical protein
MTSTSPPGWIAQFVSVLLLEYENAPEVPVAETWSVLAHENLPPRESCARQDDPRPNEQGSSQRGR